MGGTPDPSHHEERQTGYIAVIKFSYFAGMRRYRFIFLFLLFFALACKEKDKKQGGRSENHLDAARNFIRAALDGKFNEARSFLLQDSINTNYMDVAERAYQRSDQTVKDGYRSASINILDVKNLVKDSVAVVIFSNSFKNDPDTLKLIKANGQWQVDLKYLYLHDQDTTHSEIINDKIK
jgi:hypothetical protein